MILSVHIPKTAGNSFLDHLILNFGEERVCLRGDQTPLRYRAEAQPVPLLDLTRAQGCSVVHGHFVADRLILPPDDAPPRYVVWLRHPVERLISHYFYWKREPYLDQPICRLLVEQRLSVEAFAALEGMRNLQRFFIGSRPLDRFTFVGVTERFDESIERFNATFATTLHPKSRVNANPNKPGDGYRSLVGERAYDAIAALNSADMDLYQCALASCH